MAKNKIDLMIRTREEIVFQGIVKSISAKNEVGKFDILPRHANFISLLNETLIFRLEDGSQREIKITNGVLKTQENQVQVFLDIKS